MNPEEARELRDAATPGPWHVHTRDRHIDGETETWLYVGDTPALPVDHQLMSAAPELAEIVAGLRYEYAVQVKDEEWRTLANAWTSREEAKARYDATPGKRTGRVRIVRRLASDVEVVE